MPGAQRNPAIDDAGREESCDPMARFFVEQLAR
jgi:hypothetical protein